MGRLLTHLFEGDFSPGQVSGLALWLDASDQRTTTAVATALSNWNDKSTNSNDAVDAGAGQEPTLVASGQNNRDVVDFVPGASGDVMLVSADASINNLWDGGGYAACVVRFDSDGGADTGRLLDKSGTGTGWFLDFREESVGNVKFNFKQEFSTTRYVGRSTAADIALTNYRVIEFNYDSGDTANVVDVLVDGVTETISTAVSPAGTRVSDTSDDLGVGGQGTGGTGVSIDGRVGEVLLYSSIPSEIDRAKIRAYLLAKWAAVAAVASGQSMGMLLSLTYA